MINKFDGEYRFLSNFFPCDVVFNGVLYPSVEHAYQAAKTLDLEQREKIRLCPTAAQAKKLGRKVTLRHEWDDIKVFIMYRLLQSKFSEFRNPELKAKLKATGKQILIEGNWWGDTFWGVYEPTGRGENHLGKLLMRVREGR